VDKQLLEQLRKGDQRLFSALVRDHHRALLALATPIVGASEAPEVVQIAWVKAYQSIDRFEGRSQIRTWLGRIVINEAKMQLRSRKRELLFADAASDDGEAPDERFDERGHWQKPPVSWCFDAPDALLMGEELRDCLERLLASLPDNQRALLEMRDSSELPFEEICNTLSISASNARVLLHRARAQLFKWVNHYQETGEC
jgi:RNA polymerase sigma-70 factor (ECF subfamily)